MRLIKFSLLLLLLAVTLAQAEVVGEEVDYSSGDLVMKGYLAYDDSLEGLRPGILVVHEWWGHNDYARERARMLAELGYTALAVDMYGEGKQAEHPDEAGKFVQQTVSNMEAAEERFLAAKKLLEDHSTVDPERIGAIGYCFGGGVVLTMAARGVDLDGVVSFHGGLGSVPVPTDSVTARMLVCNGADDNFVTQEHIETFKKNMEEAGVDYTFKNYEGALHSFTNPDADKYAEKFGLAVSYNQEADRQSWQDMQEFFGKIWEE